MSRKVTTFKFSEWASGFSRFTVSVPDDAVPRSVTFAMQFDSIKVDPFFPAHIAFSGGQGRIDLRYIGAIEQISDNSFRIQCGRRELPDVHRTIIVTAD